MAGTSRVRATGRRDKGSYMAIPHAVVSTKKYSGLSGWAVRLLVDMLLQYRGSNNGDLCAAWTVMKQRGWRSRGTLTDATKELLDAGLILLTRQGGKNRPNLYAVTWLAVDECRDPRTRNHKLDVPPSDTAPGTWRDQ